MKYSPQIKTDVAGRTYLSYDNDPSQTRIYTLSNGLQVYLAKNTDEPRIQCYVAIKAGSAQDPSDTTGLAHYLEHLLFKGTTKIGTLDWESEKPLLVSIKKLFEKHRNEKDITKKKEIYAEIDRISVQASQFSIANEYDKLMSNLGVKNLNAHTWLDETIYKANVPKDTLELFLQTESERFSNAVFRLFHTELETVYEEYNRALDQDARLVQYTIMDALFPTHPYGQQTTLGSAEHLKNPSLEAIQSFFNTYYVPSNMAISLVGDLAYEETIAKVDTYFGQLQNKLPQVSYKKIKEEPLTAVVEKIVTNPTDEWVQIGFRTEGVTSSQIPYLQIIDFILCNGQTGIIDIQINQRQKAIDAYSHLSVYNEYGTFLLGAHPIENQSLESLKTVLLESIAQIKAGHFDPEIITAVINNLTINRLKSWERSQNIGMAHYQSFIKNKSWDAILGEIDQLSISYEELVAFANDFFVDNYVVVYKHQGENSYTSQVDKPIISSINLNQEKTSHFAKEIQEKINFNTQAQWVDFDKDILKESLHDFPLYSIKNKTNDLAEIHFILEKGKDHSLELQLAIEYIQLLDNELYTNESLRKAFFEIGAKFSLKTYEKETIISLFSLQKNMQKAIDLLKSMIENCIVDEQKYIQLVDKIIKNRQAAKSDPQQILTGALHWVRFGEKNRFKRKLSESSLRAIRPSDLVDLSKQLFTTPHSIFYYGNDKESIYTYLYNSHKYVVESLTDIELFEPTPQINNGKVFGIQYDSVQVQYVNVLNTSIMQLEDQVYSKLINDYFGSGLSSVVFQELREKQSLAYSAYAYFHVANEKDKTNYYINYIGTSTDKIAQAIDGFSKLNTNFPQIANQFENSKANIIQQLKNNRIVRANQFWHYRDQLKKGFATDSTQEVLTLMEQQTLSSVTNYFTQNFQSQQADHILIGDFTKIDLKDIQKLGEITYLSIDSLF